MTENEVMKTFSENFKRMRKEKGLLQKEVADSLDVSSSIVSDWEKGVKMPRGGAIQKIAELFNIHQNELFIERGFQYSTFKEILNVPVVGKISYGDGNLLFENIQGYEPAPKEWFSSGEYFYFRAKDDSMVGARICEGDLLLISKQAEVESGEIAAILLGNDVVLKRVYRNGDQLVLQSENSAYGPIFCTPDEARIIGKLKMNVIRY